MSENQEVIPTSNPKLMVFLGNYETQINGFMTGGLAPDGEPYFYNRAKLRWNNIVVPALAALQLQWTPVSIKRLHNPLQTEAFNIAKEEFLKDKFRPFNKEFVASNSAFTPTNRGTIGIQPVANTPHTAASDPNQKLVPIHLALKKQIHLVIEIEVVYPGTKSKKKQKGVKDVCLYQLVQAANLTTIPDPNSVAYTHIGDMKGGVFTANFTLAQENEAALFTMREKGKNGKFGAYIGVFRVVIS